MPGGAAGVQALLRSALAHVPSKGFTVAAIRNAAQDSSKLVGDSRGQTLDRALERLFPGPDTAPTSGPRRLFQVWDDDASRQMMLETSTGDEHVPYEKAFQGAIKLLENRLLVSAAVRPHLLPVGCIRLT